MKKIKAPEYFCGTCYICGKPAKYFHGKLQGIKCYDSGLKKPILIHAGFCQTHVMSLYDTHAETILGDYNREKMGPVLEEEELEDYYNQAMIVEDIKSLRENYEKAEKAEKWKKEKEEYERNRINYRRKSAAN